MEDEPKNYLFLDVEIDDQLIRISSFADFIDTITKNIKDKTESLINERSNFKDMEVTFQRIYNDFLEEFKKETEKEDADVQKFLDIDLNTILYNDKEAKLKAVWDQIEEKKLEMACKMKEQEVMKARYEEEIKAKTAEVIAARNQVTAKKALFKEKQTLFEENESKLKLIRTENAKLRDELEHLKKNEDENAL